MAIEPGIYNFTLQRRSDHTIPLIFKDSNNAAINLTGFTVAAQVWEQTRTTKYADFAVTYTDRSAGSVSITLTDVQTATFTPDILRYDVLLVDAGGSKEYYLEGTIYMSEGYTTT
ncbi:phage tail protein [uncultured Mediterranean phage MEDS1 group]|nr:phage tail protein [uncultured Mediterranean phage MEDS1 group]BAR21576.1 phage tail protein [uncultured Mediterranean phage uvMED]|tara:strand:+ start:326 stop:670 length:345 start_codon:yes stop_codon:yes gene_type:complete